MRKIICLSLLMMVMGSTMAQTKNKRGLSTGQLDMNDIKALSPGISWFYDWGVYAWDGIQSQYENYTEFVPMVYTGTFDSTTLVNFISTHPSVKYLLGYNEPNFTTQGNIGPIAAAGNWKKVEAVADKFNLKIVGPAMNFADKPVTENGKVYNDPIVYLDTFFVHCPNCRVDYIAAHAYGPTQWDMAGIVSMYYKYKKKIWLSEFNQLGGSTAESQKQFMVKALDILEKDTMVFRYAWLLGRTSPQSSISIFKTGVSGGLTDLGKVYVNMSSYDTAFYHKDSTFIQAEHYVNMSGIDLEATTDTSGAIDVKAITSGQWMDYNLDLKVSGEYYIYFRAATSSTSSLKLLNSKGTTLQTQNISSTSGLWKTFYVKVTLPAGKQKIRIQGSTGSVNLNWLWLTKTKAIGGSTGIESVKLELTTVYPNPVKEILKIASTETIETSEIYDLIGNLVMVGIGNELNVSALKPAIYFVHITTKNNEIIIRKLIKE